MSVIQFLFIAIILVLGPAWLWFMGAIGYSAIKKTAGWSRCFGIVGTLLVGVGGIGFFGSMLASLGILFWLPNSFEWPIGYVSSVAQTEDHYYVVPHSGASRIQIYDSEWNYKTGWFVDSRSKAMKVSRIDGEEFEVVVANHKQARFTFDLTGQLISQGSYVPVKYADLPDVGVGRYVPTAIWLLPFSHPGAGWLTAIAGIALLVIARKSYSRPMK